MMGAAAAAESATDAGHPSIHPHHHVLLLFASLSLSLFIVGQQLQRAVANAHQIMTNCYTGSIGTAALVAIAASCA